MAARKAMKVVRNRTGLPVNIRLGSKADPYHIQLERRGTEGDVAYIPVDLADHPIYKRNVDKVFEEITAAQADAIAYHAAVPNAFSGMNVGEFERVADQSTVVGYVDDTPKGPIRRPDWADGKSLNVGDRPLPAGVVNSSPGDPTPRSIIPAKGATLSDGAMPPEQPTFTRKVQ